jgi:hypothetical protein
MPEFTGTGATSAAAEANARAQRDAHEVGAAAASSGAACIDLYGALYMRNLSNIMAIEDEGEAYRAAQVYAAKTTALAGCVGGPGGYLAFAAGTAAQSTGTSVALCCAGSCGMCASGLCACVQLQPRLRR